MTFILQVLVLFLCFRISYKIKYGIDKVVLNTKKQLHTVNAVLFLKTFSSLIIISVDRYANTYGPRDFQT